MVEKIVVTGKDTLIHMRKRGSGKDYSLVDEVQVPNDESVVQDGSEALFVTTMLHRTIPLGNWEFARVGMGIRMGMPMDMDDAMRVGVLDSCRDVINEILDREEACVKGDKRRFRDIHPLPKGVAASVWMDYGLTFKGSLPMETHKIDLSSPRYVPEGESIEDAVVNIQHELSERIFGYKNSVLDSGDAGF